jgi:hypothetical protein
MGASRQADGQQGSRRHGEGKGEGAHRQPAGIVVDIRAQVSPAFTGLRRTGAAARPYSAWREAMASDRSRAAVTPAWRRIVSRWRCELAVRGAKAFAGGNDGVQEADTGRNRRHDLWQPSQIGKQKHFRYRSSSYLTEFFRDCDTDYEHDSSTRNYWVVATLREILAQPQPDAITPPQAFANVVRTLMDQGDAVDEGPERPSALERLNAELSRARPTRLHRPRRTRTGRFRRPK